MEVLYIAGKHRTIRGGCLVIEQCYMFHETEG